MRGVKLGGGEETSELHFDVDAKLEEKERRSGKIVVSFLLKVSTKPSVVKFEVEGLATLEGKNPEIEKLLEMNPKTKIPPILHNVYQRVFMSTFLLATLLGTSYPPPDLLFSGEMGKGLGRDELGKKEKEFVELKKKAQKIAEKTEEKRE